MKTHEGPRRSSIAAKMILFFCLLSLIVNGVFLAVSYASASAIVKHMADTELNSITRSVIDLLAVTAERATPEETAAAVRQKVLAIKIGETGYPFILDANGLVLVHPNLEGKNIASLKDPVTGAEFIRSILNQKNGVITYNWQNPLRDNRVESKAVRFMYFERFNWIVATGIWETELYAPVVTLRNRLALLTLGSTAIFCIASIIIALSIARPIRTVSGILEIISNGDLRNDVHADILQKSDEVGALGRSTATMLRNLNEIINTVKAGAANVSAATTQISTGNQNLSRHTMEQSSSLEETAAALEQMAGAMKSTAQNITQADTSARDARDAVGMGISAVESAAEQMDMIISSSSEIATITRLIEDIAFQTNLLALNAAVEAARAGEKGRGFAVVAGEVRNLAQRSGTAVKDINVLIKDMLQKIETGKNEVGRTVESLDAINRKVIALAGVVENIRNESREQELTIDQITTAMSTLNSITQNNSALVEETASASEEIAAQAEELLASIEFFTVAEKRFA